MSRNRLPADELEPLVSETSTIRLVMLTRSGAGLAIGTVALEWRPGARMPR